MIERKSLQFKANYKKVLCQFFEPGDEKRFRQIIDRIMGLTDKQTADYLEQVFQEFSSRHKNFSEILINHYNRVSYLIENSENLNKNRKLLIGSYFSKEYSIEAAALFNPSMTPHPDQSNLKPGNKRFIMSFRATGEGHISSVEFVSGIVDQNGNISVDPISKYCVNPQKTELRDDIVQMTFNSSDSVSERVLFPNTPDESNGIEDVRLVRFVEGDDNVTYYGTYTAYNGTEIKPKLIETKDFVTFKMRPLTGKAAVNKGMALFPRKINGKYAMVSRQDGENILIMFSDDLHRWDESQIMQEPVYPWEFIQLGNCGSPVETEAGWILLSHSVGPMRKYVISAYLLDLNDPSKVIGRLEEPLISPDENEREGYVPNVVYSCGGMINDDTLIIPYAMSDYASGFASVGVGKLLSGMKK
ncbi:MAG: glycoside hydrolase family 130 protein [Calditrichaceae bacterium]